jgi:acyl-CoA thioesterase-1
MWIVCAGGCGRPGSDPNAGRERGAEPPPVYGDRDERPVIAAFGDSLTAGSGVDPAQNYPSQLQAKLDAEGYRYRVVNAGVSGETSSQGLNRAKSVLALEAAIVIIEFGGNDGLRGVPVETTRRNLAAMVSLFRSKGAKVILAGMEMPPNYGPQYTSDFRNMFVSVAKQHQAALVPFFLEGVGGRRELNQDDGIHPTAEGYTIVVENVWKVLRPLL